MRLLVRRDFRFAPVDAFVDATRLKVLVRARAGETLTDLIWNALARATQPQAIQFCILVDCDRASDLHAVDARLRRRVLVEYEPSSRSAGAGRARLARRFLRGDEPAVALLHARARPLHGWDATLVDLLERVPDGGALSAPTAARDGTARFPCLRRRSTGAAARDSSKPFARKRASARLLVRSVCWCAELVAFRPGAAVDWLSRPSFVPADGDGRRLYVPTVPLLEHDDALEDDVLDEDDGCEQHTLRDAERAGLTARASDAERIEKYGSIVHAELAVKAVQAG